MEQRESNKRSQFRGFLFELVFGRLLEESNFHRVNVDQESVERVREDRLGFIEFRGRGCWHQIDCPYDYNLSIPFSNPLRLLGEVKFYSVPLSKRHIREFVGVIKDIQENYITIDDIKLESHYPRRLEFGVYVSANGFNEQAERLAYAQGIKTLSYKNNFLVDRIKCRIDDLTNIYLISNRFDADNRKLLRLIFMQSSIENAPAFFDGLNLFNSGYERAFTSLLQDLKQIKTSFIGTTATGIYLHFVSNSFFPFELFETSDSAPCKVYYDSTLSNQGNFRLIFSNDQEEREFFFSPPTSLFKAASIGTEHAIRSKEDHFRYIYVSIKPKNGEIKRNLTLLLDQDWLTEAYLNART